MSRNHPSQLGVQNGCSDHRDKQVNQQSAAEFQSANHRTDFTTVLLVAGQVSKTGDYTQISIPFDSVRIGTNPICDPGQTQLPLVTGPQAHTPAAIQVQRTLIIRRDQHFGHCRGRLFRRGFQTCIQAGLRQVNFGSLTSSRFMA